MAAKLSNIPVVVLIVSAALIIGCSKKTASPNDDGSQPHGSFTDSRDGKTYKTIMIGTQTWMAENLNIGTRINGSVNQTNNGVIEKYAYNDNDSIASTHGGLYQWNEAMNYDITEGIQGICPSGWHIPTDAEWDTLVNAVGGSSTGGTALKEGGSSGFEALLSGYCEQGGSFCDMGSTAYLWSSSLDDAIGAWFRNVFSAFTVVHRDSYTNRTDAFCVRCLKD